MREGSVKGKICLVTGANTGIGLETARALAQQGAGVMMTARSPEKGAAALADVQETVPGAAVSLVHLDLASLDSVRKAAADVLSQHKRLDVLVNNAGLILDERRETDDGFEATFGINHLGHFLLTWLLRDALTAAAPSRVVNVSSTAHQVSRGLDFDDLMAERRRYTAMGAYADSKLANVLFTRELARRLKDQNITAYAVHPGAVGSSFASDGDIKGIFATIMKIGRPLLLSPARGARTSIHCATAKGIEAHSGGYFARCRPKKTSAAGRDDEAARKLWEVSAQLTGVA
jgi:retinol dehydrogenase-12